MATRATGSISNHQTETYWEGVELDISTAAGELSSNLSRVQVVAKPQDVELWSAARTLTLDSDNAGEITIDSAANWQATVEGVVVNLPPGEYYVDVFTWNSETPAQKRNFIRLAWEIETHNSYTGA